MPQPSPGSLASDFRHDLQDVIDCISYARVVINPKAVSRLPDDALILKPLRAELDSEEGLTLRLMHAYRVDETAQIRKLTTVSYGYYIEDAERREVISYHYHPHSAEERVFYPHIHVRSVGLGQKSFHKLHIPTGRIALEDVVHFLITEMGVKPKRQDWEDVLAAKRPQFEDAVWWHLKYPNAGVGARTT